MTMTEAVSNNEKRTTIALRWVGYGLLLLALFDIIAIFVPFAPSQLMDPFWMFQTMGELVERVPVPLIGLVLVFYGGRTFRGKGELLIIKLLSWLCCLVGILYLILILTGISNTWRIYQYSKTQISSQANQRLEQLQQIEQQLNSATPQDITNFLTRLNQGRPVQVENPQQAKEQLLSQLAQGKNNLQTQIQTTQKNSRLGLFKNSLKWNLGALVAGVLFLRIWSFTRWARFSPPKEFS